MDPVSMILAFALQNPQVASQAVNNYSAPGQVNAARLQESVADFAMETLNCYHRTSRFRGVEVLGTPWVNHANFGAENSVVIRIHLAGASGSAYQMVVAAMAKGNSFRTFVLQENTMIPYNKRCGLEQWTSVQR